MEHSIFYETDNNIVTLTGSELRRASDKIVNKIKGIDTRLNIKDTDIRRIKRQLENMEKDLKNFDKIKDELDRSRETERIAVDIMILAPIILQASLLLPVSPIMSISTMIGGTVGMIIGNSIGKNIEASIKSKKIGKDKSWVINNISKADLIYAIEIYKDGIEKLEKRKTEIIAAGENTVSIFY